jgi:DNA primase
MTGSSSLFVGVEVGIDYRELRAVVSMQDILALIGFLLTSVRGDQLRGPCPLPESKGPKSTSFSANNAKKAFRCFRCGAAGNHLDLWVAWTKLPLHDAAIDLCRRLDRMAPHIRKKRRGTRTNSIQ